MEGGIVHLNNSLIPWLMCIHGRITVKHPRNKISFMYILYYGRQQYLLDRFVVVLIW